MDITQLSQLPLSVLVILGAYWVIQRHNDEYAKRLIELIGQFSEKYTELIKRATEEREEARQRWHERDKLLISTLVENQRILVENTKENHNLRTTLSPMVTWWQVERRRAQGAPAQTGDAADATG